MAATLYFQVEVSANQGEVGTLTVSQSGANQWHKVEMIHSYVNPVVILGPPTDNDPAPLALRIRNLRSDSVNLTERIRSYLAVHCVSCHQPGGTGLGSWDARPEVSLLSTGIINGLAGKNGGNPDNRLIVPGNPEASILLSRLSGCCGFTRMPPLASSELDQEAVDRMTEWIELLDNTQAYRSWRLENFGSDSSQEGDPAFNADTDQFSNYFEFLLASNPNEAGSSPFVQLDISSEKASLIYESLAQRSIQLEISEDMINWEPWYQGSPVEHFNQGEVQYSKIEGPIELEDARQLFFRISVLWAP
ncbi:hypothetical protein F7C95_08945 [Opitutia bacterium ISCC 51]|nr:hypothetical protein F7C95_08945 [Opitutae bacterium ISCC 51]QXD30058.1 hypothetical protein GA003_08890 [Opitutae bacterium ISCC 52]